MKGNFTSSLNLLEKATEFLRTKGKNAPCLQIISFCNAEISFYKLILQGKVKKRKLTAKEVKGCVEMISKFERLKESCIYYGKIAEQESYLLSKGYKTDWNKGYLIKDI